jgi:hypothetical protein
MKSVLPARTVLGAICAARTVPGAICIGFSDADSIKGYWLKLKVTLTFDTVE